MAREIITETAFDTNSIAFKFKNGLELRASTGDLSEEIVAMLALHGLKQKLADAMAIPCDAITGKSATMEDKFAAATKVWENLLSGQWGQTRQSGGGEPKGGYLFHALVELYTGKKTPDDIRAFLAGKSKADQAKLRANAKVAPIIERLKAEAVKAKGIDTDSMLDELDGEI